MPCFGAGTANTEFEVQTGMNMDDFGPGEYPYKTVLQSKVCESMAYDLKEKGYATHALHDNDGTFYDRYKVFSHLGYEDFTSIEYMDNIEMTPMGWAKDKILTGEIGKILDSTRWFGLHLYNFRTGTRRLSGRVSGGLCAGNYGNGIF